MVEDEGELLVVLLETHPALFTKTTVQGKPQPPNPFEQIMIFLNCFMLLNAANELVVYAVHEKSCPILHRSEKGSSLTGKNQLASTIVLSAFQDLMKRAPNSGKGGCPSDPALSAAISRALCFIHRQKLSRKWGFRSTKPRILIFTASMDASVQYIPMMNAIFSAQHAEVLIDSCHLGAQDSSFLQQASHITGGVYIRPLRKEALLEYLNSTFATDSHSRGHLKPQVFQSVNFKASCFCHKQPIDLGFVCSVCLSIFCRYVMECPTCGTSFVISKGKKG
ncbi:hypothetical protein BSKO_09626 [Bryopsis sp. KO-2023]|nr:hypothetical protein BSKO_09626 [Bryopsis sp. KO-2023]